MDYKQVLEEILRELELEQIDFIEEFSRTKNWKDRERIMGEMAGITRAIRIVKNRSGLK